MQENIVVHIHVSLNLTIKRSDGLPVNQLTNYYCRPPTFLSPRLSFLLMLTISSPTFFPTFLYKDAVTRFQN